MAKGNDGNYLQHCIEVAAAFRLARTNSDGRLHIALTHGMAPFEPLEKRNGDIQYKLLYSALEEAEGEPQKGERRIVSTYRDSEASPDGYPNSAELLRTVIGTNKLSGGIAETDPKKCSKLVDAWSDSRVNVKNSSWREQLDSDGVLGCPVDLDSPWLFSMDPMAYKEVGDEDDDYLHYKDLTRLENVLNGYFRSEQPGVACMFVYNMAAHGHNSQEKFLEFGSDLAKRIGAYMYPYWIPHDSNKEKYNFALVFCTEIDFLSCGISTGCPNIEGGGRSRKILTMHNVSLGRGGPSLKPEPIQNTNAMTKKQENDQRRIDRMEYWISHAQSTDAAHIQFLFYWIAYEAGYKVEQQGIPTKEYELRICFHKKISECKYSEKNFQRILKIEKQSAKNLLRLRQANRRFWHRNDEWGDTPRSWDTKFHEAYKVHCKTLDIASFDGRKLADIFNILFENLYIVRNQIVHGGSSGEKSLGRNQVIWGAALLRKIVPAFRRCIRENPSIDWGDPPFPRVGEKPDEDCVPPWMSITE